MIRRAFVKILKELFTFLYKTYVRPHLDYLESIFCQGHRSIRESTEAGYEVN